MITTRLASGGMPSSLRRHSSLAGAVPGSGQAARARGGGSVARQARDQRQDGKRRVTTPDHAGQRTDTWPTLRAACA